MRARTTRRWLKNPSGRVMMSGPLFDAGGPWALRPQPGRRFVPALFLSSSMAEHPAVNRRVAGSSPA
jgi:hypothetical protein